VLKGDEAIRRLHLHSGAHGHVQNSKNLYLRAQMLEFPKFLALKEVRAHAMTSTFGGPARQAPAAVARTTASHRSRSTEPRVRMLLPSRPPSYGSSGAPGTVQARASRRRSSAASMQTISLPLGRRRGKRGCVPEGWHAFSVP
jgi:hypothetical protein